MEANVFISKLKADGSKNDLTNLDAILRDYKEILTKLTTKDRGLFSLNVLCTLCRNLEKIPSWRAQVDSKALINLTIECVRRTQDLETADNIKTLACIYHIHRHVVRQTSIVPPELILKLSYIPFATDNLLKEYCKTYWNILADRITYIERLKSQKIAIKKLFQKLTEDIIVVIKMYNTVQFCATIITFLVKKLHYLYNDSCAIDLNTFFGKIFQEISVKNDLKYFKKLPETELLDLYVKFNDCLYVIGENASKVQFKESVLNTVVRTCITLLGHCTDYLHCFQTFYLNGLCSILTTESNKSYTETILVSFVSLCETTEKLGYVKAMKATYPYINQFLRLFIEFDMTNSAQNTEEIQNAILKLMGFLMKKLKHCNQILKCENCAVKSGLHDALRSSFLIKNFMAKSLQDKNPTTKVLPTYFSTVMQQYEILQELCNLGCNNYEKCYKKLQSDVHNTAITLNKSENFEVSIKLFDVYLRNEITHFKNENDLKNISRALYNKSICELDSKLYENALSDAYLSLIFAYPEGLSSEKYMSLVMDIKAKVLKLRDDDDENNDLQMMTVLDACAEAIEARTYGNLKPFFCNLKFSELLHHEFTMYAKLWPSLVPIAGVWKTLYDLTQHDVPWLVATDDSIQQTLYDIILETPTAVRTIQNENFSEIVAEIVDRFEENNAKTLEQRILHASLLFLKAEYDLAEAGLKYGWKPTEPTTDPDQSQALRTLPQEHEATKCAIQAVELWTSIMKDLKCNAPKTVNLQNVLYIIQIFVPQLLHMNRTVYGLQLAHVCCGLADIVGDRESYILNLSHILYYASKETREITQMIGKANQYCGDFLKNNVCLESALRFICLCALYYNKTGRVGVAGTLVLAAQAKILQAYEKTPDLNLDLAVGTLLEVQSCLSCADMNALSAVIGAHRHYITVSNQATKHHSRRLRSSTLKLHISQSGVRATSLPRRLLLWQRARGGAGGAAAGNGVVVANGTNTSAFEDAQIKIDNRLKHILGLQPSADQPIQLPTQPKHNQLFTPKQDLETMLEHLTFKKNQTSPLSCLRIPGYQAPEFFSHDVKCKCYACDNLFSMILACRIVALEASMYFRAKEVDIAKNYFDGAFRCLKLTEERLKIFDSCQFEGYVVNMSKDLLFEELRKVEVDVLIEAAFFELSQANYKMADELVIKIHELMQEFELNPYIKNEVLNLMTTSAKLRQGVRKIESLEAEFECLKLSPVKPVEQPKTPEAKAEKPPKIPKVKVKDEEIPNRRKVIKLNFDEEENVASTKKTVKKRTEFKIPVPITAKPVLECATPTPRRTRRPEILVTPAEPITSIFDVATPKCHDASEFSTPLNSTTEQFFTPMTSVKTYSKKSLRQNIVKNLETEFATPKAIDKENKSENKTETKSKKVETGVEPESKKVETGSVKSLKDKRSLRRATSPGKLEKVEKKPTRSRIRQPQI